MGPRLFGAFIYGWKKVFSIHNYFFWVPIVGPIVGAIVGVWLYQGFLWIVKRYGDFPIFGDNDTVAEIVFKDMQIKEKDSSSF